MMGLDLLASDLDDHTSMPIGAPMRRPLSITRRKGENPVQTEDRHCETVSHSFLYFATFSFIFYAMSFIIIIG